MCGIWFYIQEFNPLNHNAIYKASNEITKRGPDRTITQYHRYYIMKYL